MKPAHAKQFVFCRLGFVLILGVLTASQGPIVRAAQSPPLQGELSNSPSLVDHSESGPQLLSLVRYRRRAYRRPRWGAPRWAYGGAARGDGCLDDNASPVVPLVPLDAGSPEQVGLADNAAFLGLTGRADPSFLVYVPQTTAVAVNLLVIDEKRETEDPFDGEIMYEGRIPLTQTPGIVRFDLNQSNTAKALMSPAHYTWKVSLVCNSVAPNQSPFVEGLIQRVPPAEEVGAEAAGLPPRERVNRFAEAGLWHETLAELGNLYCEHPDDTDLAADWRSLLDSLNLTNAPDLVRQIQVDTIADAPLLWCQNSQEETPDP